MQKIPTYLINLARREDRLVSISAHLQARGVEFTRIDAVDYQSLSEEKKVQIEEEFADMEVYRRAVSAVWCCTESHRKAWRAFLETEAEYALFLEDDVYLSVDIAQLLADNSWIGRREALIKLEQDHGRAIAIIGPPFGKLPVRRDLRKLELISRGSGAYILSQEGVRRALAFSEKAKLPIDHILFDMEKSALAKALRPAIILPCMAVQPDISDSDLDIKKQPAKKPTQPVEMRLRLLLWWRGIVMLFLFLFVNRRYIVPIFQEDMDSNKKPDAPDEKEKH